MKVDNLVELEAYIHNFFTNHQGMLKRPPETLNGYAIGVKKTIKRCLKKTDFAKQQNLNPGELSIVAREILSFEAYKRNLEVYFLIKQVFKAYHPILGAADALELGYQIGEETKDNPKYLSEIAELNLFYSSGLSFLFTIKDTISLHLARNRGLKKKLRSKFLHQGAVVTAKSACDLLENTKYMQLGYDPKALLVPNDKFLAFGEKLNKVSKILEYGEEASRQEVVNRQQFEGFA